ncbi:MAG: hypothetical protein KDC49_19185 [Saprospiraceae bacterium]|nr:hypothetical protein [Saprospiraceae bacterium]
MKVSIYIKKYVHHSIYLFVLILLTGCAKEDFTVPEIDNPNPQNAFKYILKNGVTKVDSLDLLNLETFTSEQLKFRNVGNGNLGALNVGDVLFIPSASGEFHLSKFARRITQVSIEGNSTILQTEEPELKDIYEYFYIDITQPDQLQTRDTGMWIQMSDSTEGKIIDWNLLQFEFPLADQYKVNFKMSNLVAKLDMRYKVTTEFVGSNNQLQNFTFKAVEVKLKDFTFGAEVEVKRNNMPVNPGETTVVIGGGSFTEVDLVRVPGFVIPAGIPIQVSLDFGASLEAAVAGKASLGIDFGDFNITGDTLEVRFATMSLNTALWSAFTGNLSSQLSELINGYDVVSYPSTVGFTAMPCLTVGLEFQGFIKPSLIAGLSFAPVGATTLGVGIYMDVFGEMVGKMTYMSPCLANNPPNLGTLQACVEINRGFKPPYLMFTAKGSGTSYSALKLEAFGEFKNTMYRFPEMCDPLAFVSLGTSSIATACSGIVSKLYFGQNTSTLIADNGFFRARIGSQTFNNLAYSDVHSFDFTQFGGSVVPGTSYTYTFEDMATGRVVKTGVVVVPDCNADGCTAVLDPNADLPTYGDQTYCDFQPAIPGYNRRWIRENMYYTPIHRTSYDSDAFTDGIPFQNMNNQQTKDFGRLYSFWAANARRQLGSFSDWTGDICPRGYHIPSKTEWEELISAAQADFNPYKLLDESWSSSGNPELNESGFSIKPYGYYTVGGIGNGPKFIGGGEKTYFWTSTEAAGGPPGVNGNAWAVEVTEDDIKLVTSIKNQGYFCRCIKN